MGDIAMKRSLLIFASVALMLSMVGGCRKKAPVEEQPAGQTGPKEVLEPVEKVDLKILYAGHPGSEREKEFVDFLSKHFREVATGDLTAFDGSQAAGADVTILDYDERVEVPQIPQGYAAPTITVGVVGALICDELELAPGYM